MGSDELMLSPMFLRGLHTMVEKWPVVVNFFKLIATMQAVSI